MCHCFGHTTCINTTIDCDTVCIAAGDPGLILQFCHRPTPMLSQLRTNCENNVSIVGFCCFSELCNTRQAFMDYYRSTEMPPSTEPPTNMTMDPTTVVTTTSAFDTINMSTAGMSIVVVVP